MAYIFLTALAVALSPTPIDAQRVGTEPSPLSFRAAEWSFGDIREEGGAVRHTFELINRGDTPVAIDRVVASCGCTTSDYPRTPIAPGAGARVGVIFDPQGMPGRFSKGITVVSGGGKYYNYLTVSGEVIPRPKTVGEEFPFEAGGGLRFSSTLLIFRPVAQGHSSAMVSGYVNTSDRAVTLAWENVEGSGFVDIHAPETVCAGCRGDITFTYDLSGKTAYGPRFDVVRPVVDGTPSPLTIHTSMTGIDDFEGVDAALAPKFFLDAVYHDFGAIRRRTIPYTFRLEASNEGSEVLHIRSVNGPDGLAAALREGMTIAPGASLPFEVMFYSDKYPRGKVQAAIRLVVDDPMRPTREIRIAADIE